MLAIWEGMSNTETTQIVTTTTKYAVVDAPGYHGDYVTIWSVHTDLTAAKSAKRRGGRSTILVEVASGGVEPGKIGRGPMTDLMRVGSWRVLPVR